MKRLLTETTPLRVYYAVDALMNAEVGRGPFRFIEAIRAHIDAIPDRHEDWAGDAEMHPVDDAVEMARFFAQQVRQYATARRWKAASEALKFVEDSQETYWVRRHVESLRPIPGCTLRGYTTQRVPRIHVYAAENNDHLFHLPPESSQEAIEAALDSFLAGYKRGATHSAQIVRGIANNIEAAVQ